MSMNATIDSHIGALSLEEKVTLLTGKDVWNTAPAPEIGLRSVLLSDGPCGVRGEHWDERQPSLNLPSSTSLGSTWSREMAGLYGHVLGSEARQKHVGVVLGPTINIHRTPYGGRHFECLSEDPVLTGDLTVAYVQALQAQGVGATPKHYVANDFETDRFSVDVIVEDRTLREIYLRPFEQSVREADAWAIMSAYNSINGTTATEHDLLESPLRSEWGFTGAVISDWTAVRSLASAEAEQDLVMPGPHGPWGAALLEAVESGAIDESVVDRKVGRLLLLAARVGAIELEGFSRPDAVILSPLEGDAAARQLAIEGTVLLRNEDNLLPLDLEAGSSIALIGHNATLARTQGGGSATVLPPQVSSPADAIVGAFGSERVRTAIGAIVHEGIGEFPLEMMTNPVTGQPGVRVSFLDESGAELATEDRLASTYMFFDGIVPLEDSSSIVLRTEVRFETAGMTRLGYAGVNPTTMLVDGELILQDRLVAEGDDPAAGFLSPPSTATAVNVEADKAIELMLTVDVTENVGVLAGGMSFGFGMEPDSSDPAGLLAEAVEVAKGCDLAIVVVGTNSLVESEGYDRDSLALPGHQDELVKAVAAANANTVVIVNSGSPVLLPWRNEVDAILLPYFPGQAFGSALVDMLTGVAEPGGRLPTTWPETEGDVPVGPIKPENGKVAYDDGIHVGYRAWLRAGTKPAYPFGFGLGYSAWSLGTPSGPAIVEPTADFTIEVPLTNDGSRTSKQVVQVYAERKESNIDRPVRWLVGFSDVRLDGGASAVVPITIRSRELAHWDEGWQWEPGTFTLCVATSVTDIVGRLEVAVQ